MKKNYIPIIAILISLSGLIIAYFNFVKPIIVFDNFVMQELTSNLIGDVVSELSINKVKIDIQSQRLFLVGTKIFVENKSVAASSFGEKWGIKIKGGKILGIKFKTENTEVLRQFEKNASLDRTLIEFPKFNLNRDSKIEIFLSIQTFSKTELPGIEGFGNVFDSSISARNSFSENSKSIFNQAFEGPFVIQVIRLFSYTFALLAFFSFLYWLGNRGGDQASRDHAFKRRYEFAVRKFPRYKKIFNHILNNHRSQDYQGGNYLIRTISDYKNKPADNKLWLFHELSEKDDRDLIFYEKSDGNFYLREDFISTMESLIESDKKPT